MVQGERPRHEYAAVLHDQHYYCSAYTITASVDYNSHLVGRDAKIFSQPRIFQTLSEESITTKAGVAAMTLDIREEMLDDGGGYYIANVFGARHVLEGHAYDTVATERGSSAVARVCTQYNHEYYQWPCSTVC